MGSVSQLSVDTVVSPRGQMTIDEEFADAVYPRPWNSTGLQAAGWSGLLPLMGLDKRVVTMQVGVYTVVRARSTEALFTRLSRQRGSNNALEDDVVARRWVEGASVLYIGQTSARGGLQRRLRPFSTASAGHSGGRAIWQLEEHAELLVAWLATPPRVIPQLAEAALISRFRRDHQGRVPFANAVK